MENPVTTKVSPVQVYVPLLDEDKKILNFIKSQGIQKGHYVAKAIHNQLIADGYLKKTD